MIAAAMIASVARKRHAGAADSSRMAIARGFSMPAVSQGADPHIGGGVKTVESPTSA